MSRFKAVTFDAYGTLLQNPGVTAVARRIVADHGLSAPTDDVARCWVDLYHEATQRSPFQTLRVIHGEILPLVLHRFGVSADTAGYVDLFFRETTRVELYPEALAVLNALKTVRRVIISNADHDEVVRFVRHQTSRRSRAGSSIRSFTRTRNVTACSPSTSR